MRPRLPLRPPPADVRPVELPDARLRIVQPDLAELQLDFRAFLDGQLRREVFALPLGEDEEVVEVYLVFPDEIEPAPRLRLQLDEALGPGADDERRDLRGDLDAVRLRARARRERAEPALDVERRGSLRDDDPVAAAPRALLRHHFARPVGDVLARHLHEPERRDLDHVRLRPVALELP
ncbi:MAG: hypothetical protein JF623_05660, partial [Acidobacteria bacterium]|nr:hypothetical protein [Acidobacteriota bacterium]